MATTKPTTDADVIVTPSEVVPPNDRAGGGTAGDGAATQVMTRQEYADRLRAGATPIADQVLVDQGNATVAIIDPTQETAPAPAAVEVAASTADAEPGEVVKVKAPAAARKTAAPAKTTTRKR